MGSGANAAMLPVVISMASGSRSFSIAVARMTSNSARNRSFDPLAGKNPSPSRPARRAAASLWPPMTIGTDPSIGRGRETTDWKLVNSPV